jgi:hypothetical protein
MTPGGFVLSHLHEIKIGNYVVDRFTATEDVHEFILHLTSYSYLATHYVKTLVKVTVCKRLPHSVAVQLVLMMTAQLYSCSKSIQQQPRQQRRQ